MYSDDSISQTLNELNIFSDDDNKNITNNDNNNATINSNNNTTTSINNISLYSSKPYNLRKRKKVNYYQSNLVGKTTNFYALTPKQKKEIQRINQTKGINDSNTSCIDAINNQIIGRKRKRQKNISLPDTNSNASSVKDTNKNESNYNNDITNINVNECSTNDNKSDIKDDKMEAKSDIKNINLETNILDGNETGNGYKTGYIIILS